MSAQVHFKLTALFELTLVFALLLFPYRILGWSCIFWEFVFLNFMSISGVFLYASYANVFGKYNDGRLAIPKPAWLVVARRFWLYGSTLVLLGWLCVFIGGAMSL